MPTTSDIHLSVVTALDQIARGYPEAAIETLTAVRAALESDGTRLEDVGTSPARSSDPETSKAAAKKLTPTNHLGRLLAEFVRCGPMTAQEAIAEAELGSSSSPWKRVSELKAAKIIEPCGHANNPATGREVEVYDLTLFGRMEAARILEGPA